MNKIKIKRKAGGKPTLPQGGYGFVIGNGTSRQDLPVGMLSDYGVVYACNWFFREEFTPHVLVASDEPMTNTILKVYPQYARNNWFYTWFPKPGSGAKKAPCPEKFAAGAMAAHIAAEDHKKEKVFLIGIDFFGFGSNGKDDNGGINNLYHGKKHYLKGEDAPAPTYRNWQRRFEWIVRNYPDVDFYHVNPFEGKSPERLRGFDNFHQITWENLVEHLSDDVELVDVLEKTEADKALIEEINEDDVRGCIERQFAGQENVIFKDMLPQADVFKIRAQVQQHIAKKGGIGVEIEVHGFKIFVPATHVATKEGTRLATVDELKMSFAREMVEREKLVKESPFKGITIQVGSQPKMAPPPPPPSFGDIPPPPPPPMV